MDCFNTGKVVFFEKTAKVQFDFFSFLTNIFFNESDAD